MTSHPQSTSRHIKAAQIPLYLFLTKFIHFSQMVALFNFRSIWLLQVLIYIYRTTGTLRMVCDRWLMNKMMFLILEIYLFLIMFTCCQHIESIYKLYIHLQCSRIM